MITRTDVERLAALKNDQGVVSTYVNLDPRLAYDRSRHQAQFQGAVKQFVRRNEDERWRAALDRENARILDFLRRWEPKGRGLVIFSCQPADIWETLELDVRVPNVVDVGSTTNTAYLARLLDEYPRFVVALVQRDRASIYVAEGRGGTETAQVESVVPGRHDAGGWSQARFQRHTEVHVERHLTKVVEELQQLYYQRPFTRLAIGGTEETTQELRDMLPEPVARRVIGTFPVDVKHAREEETLQRARQLLQEDERRRELALVERVVNEAGAGAQGVLGFEDTLDAVVQGRVQTLLIVDGVTRRGAFCPACGYLTEEQPKRCPVCREEAELTDNVLEHAAERALLAGAHVELVLDEARELLIARGGAGALLRY